MQTMEIVKVYRWCARCQRWRSTGNFSTFSRSGKAFHARTCRLCWKKGAPREYRNWWVVTDLGRGALREMERLAS